MESISIQKTYELLKYDNPECVFVDDSDYYKYFIFFLCEQYFQDINDYIENEYGFTNNSDTIASFINFHEEQPIIIDFEQNITFTVKKLENEKYSKKLIHKTSYIYTCLINNISLYSPTLIATNSIYLKPIILLLHTQHNNIIGYNYILYRFLSWASVIVSKYSVLKANQFLPNYLSLPFNCTFISKPLNYQSLNIYIDLHFQSDYKQIRYSQCHLKEQFNNMIIPKQ